MAPNHSCLLCGNTLWKVKRRFKEYGLWECGKCHLVILHPQPTPVQLQDLYRADYFEHNLTAQMPENIEDVKSQIQNRWHFIEWFRTTIKKASGSLLEIGCATGFLLKAFEQQGWKTVGIELSSDASNYAHKKLGLDVRTGSVSPETLRKDRFDVMIMLHSLEHFPDPLTALKMLRPHLNDGGRLIIQVPNTASLQAHWQKNRWEGWRIPYHLYHFSPGTLKKLLKAGGFEILFREYSLPYWEGKILAHPKRIPNSIQTGSLKIPQQSRLSARFRKWLLHLNKTLPLGRDILVVAIKKE
jgi:2-polyprenyl-3-methyl-5-hydroxy-6-metoxy-1,4-benzoquinol methylase